MGKRKIAIERVEDCKRYVTFSKRKKGLFSKASTACEKYGSEIAIILFSPTGKPYVFGPVDSLIERFLHHQSSSSSLIPHPNFLSEENVISTTNSDHDHDHIEEGEKRSRSCRDDLIAERETKKRKLLMSTESAAEEEEEKEGFLLTKSETEEEEGLMKNESMGGAVASLVSDDELNETLIGFADHHHHHHHEEKNMFDLLPHQGVYDEGTFTISDNWPRIDDEWDQLLS